MNPRAMILWLARERGGRTAPPDGEYRAAARFEDSREQMWTMRTIPVRTFDGRPHATLCEVELLSSQAQADLLVTGARFNLCEGHRVVAKGVVLPETIAVPQEIDEFALSLMG